MSIEGGREAIMLSDLLEARNDRNCRRLAHLGWGTDRRARWDVLSSRGADGGGGAEARSIYGGVLSALGENRDLGGNNGAPLHIDLALRRAPHRARRRAGRRERPLPRRSACLTVDDRREYPAESKTNAFCAAKDVMSPICVCRSRSRPSSCAARIHTRAFVAIDITQALRGSRRRGGGHGRRSAARPAADPVPDPHARPHGAVSAAGAGARHRALCRGAGGGGRRRQPRARRGRGRADRRRMGAAARGHATATSADARSRCRQCRLALVIRSRPC